MSLLLCKVVLSQRTTLPVDWRQHNLSKYNANVFNPALSFVRYESTNLSLWGRLQWVGIDNAPTTYLINYNGKIGERSGAGLALFQHNIGLFTDSGLMVNYARGIRLARDSWLTLGINFIGVRRGLNPASFITPEPDPALLNNDQDFILSIMPGINLTINNFNIGFTSENLFDYNFTISDQQTAFSDKIFLGYASYDYHLKNNGNAAWNNALFRTTLYSKRVPDQDVQYGVQGFIDVPRYGWAQIGYNNFYGVAGGIGARVSQGISVGFLVETGTSSTNRAFGATYEITAAIEFGKRKKREEAISFSQGPKSKKKLARERQQKVRQANKFTTSNKDADNTKTNKAADKAQVNETVNKTTATANNNNPNIKTAGNTTADTTQLDDKSLQNIDLDKIETIDKDSDKEILNRVFNSKNENPRYKAVDRIEGVEYGFYLVVNVFAEKRYYELFMKLLSNNGLEPKSFFNSENNYNYVYLKKYDKLSDIERDRRTKFNGNYTGKTWILWVRKN